MTSMFGGAASALSKAQDAADKAQDQAKSAAASAMPSMPGVGGVERADIEEARNMLKTAETSIKSKLEASLPTIAIKLPELKSLPGDVPAAPAAGDRPSPAPAGATASEMAPLMDNVPAMPKVSAAEDIMDVITPLVSSAAGIAVAAGGVVACGGEPSPAQLYGTAVVTTFLNVMGTGRMWDKKAMRLQEVFMGVIKNTKKKIGVFLEPVDDLLCKPIGMLVAEIDEIGKDDPLKKVMDFAKKMEKTTGKDVPDKEDFKKPLNGIPEQVEEKVKEVKQMIYDKIDDMVPDVFEVYPKFRRTFVLYPMAVFFLLQLIVSILSIPAPATSGRLLTEMRMDSGTLPMMHDAHMPIIVDTGSLGNTAFMVRRMADDATNAEASVDAETKKEVDEYVDSMLDPTSGAAALAEDESKDVTKEEVATDAEASVDPETKKEVDEYVDSMLDPTAEGEETTELPAEESLAQLIMKYINPQLMQLVASFMAVVTAVIATAKPQVLKAINKAIKMMEKKVNTTANNQMKELIDKVFGTIFKELKEKADDFFGRMIDLLEALLKIPFIK